METERYYWRGNCVCLRQGNVKDAVRKREEYFDSEARSFLEYGITDLPAMSQEAYSAFFKLEDEKGKDDNLHEPISFAIDNLDGDYVGWIRMYGRNPRHGVFSVGLSIFREHQRKGYAEDALRLVLRYGFCELRFQKCNSGCRSDNVASVRLHEKVGFIQEGLQRRTIFTNNQYYDQILYGLLKEEFEEKNAGWANALF